MPFHEVYDDYMRIGAGSPSVMNYVMRVIEVGLSGASHLCHGHLKENGTQLFVDTLPQLGPGSFIQVRQKMNDGDVLSVNIITGSGILGGKNDPWHRLPPNKAPLYYVEFPIGGFQTQLAIGSGVPLERTMAFFEQKTSY